MGGNGGARVERARWFRFQKDCSGGFGGPDGDGVNLALWR